MSQYTQTDLDELDAKIREVQTVSSTEHEDQATTFRTLDEMLALRDRMVHSINSASPTSRLASTRKGV